MNADFDSLYNCLLESHYDVLKYAISGAVSGGTRAISRAFTYPLDTIKTFQQAGYKSKKKINYYKGLISATLSAAPANALFFVVYNGLEYYHEFLFGVDPSDLDNLFRRILFSAIATLPSNLVKIPAELLKQRVQLDPGLDLLSAGKQIISREGLTGFYRGGTTQLLREIPYNAFQMAFYEWLREDGSARLEPLLGGDHRLTAAVLGAVAAMLAAVLTQPADVLKTRMMAYEKPPDIPLTGDLNIGTNSGMKVHGSSSTNTRSIAQVCAELWEDQGWRGFYAGMVPRLLIVSVGGMVYFSAAEIIESYSM